MQFLVIAYDGKDEGALERRMSVRPKHLENMTKVKETGSVVCAGGIKDSDGRPIGSAMIMEFADRAAFDEYLKNEPYVSEGVWKRIEVETMNVVLVNGEKRL